jgi:hypothetical protein
MALSSISADNADIALGTGNFINVAQSSATTVALTKGHADDVVATLAGDDGDDGPTGINSGTYIPTFMGLTLTNGTAMYFGHDSWVTIIAISTISLPAMSDMTVPLSLTMTLPLGMCINTSLAVPMVTGLVEGNSNTSGSTVSFTTQAPDCFDLMLNASLLSLSAAFVCSFVVNVISDVVFV